MNIMFFLADVTLGIALFFIARLRFGSYRNISLFFSIIWMIAAAAANLGSFFGYYPVSAYVNIALIVGALVFAAIVFIFPSRCGAVDSDFSLLSGCDSIHIRLILILNICCILIMLPLLRDSVNTIAADGWAQLRASYYSSDNQTMSTVQTYLLQYVVNPCRVATIILGYILVIGRHKHGFQILVLGIVNAIAYSVVSGGRGALLTVLYFAAWSLVVDYQFGSRYLSRYLRPKYVLPVVFVFFSVLLITSGRSSSSDTILSVIYKNFFVGPIYLTQLLNQGVPGFIPDANYMLGWGTFGFLCNLPLTIGLVLGLGTRTSDYWISSYLTSGNLMVGINQYSNALSTCYYTFIMDWGTLGIVIGPALVAFASVAIVQKQKKENSVFWTGILLLWIDVLFHTITGWELLGISFFCELFFLYIFTGIREKRGQAKRI